MVISFTEFQADSQGSRFADVMADTRVDLREVIEFLARPDRVRRMAEAELDHDRPALAGVIRELEAQPQVGAFLAGVDAHETRRFRQAVGVAVRIIMEKIGWSKTGRKGSLGKRERVTVPTSQPGAYRNYQGVSTWFTRAERYVLPESADFAAARQETYEAIDRAGE
ncbi:MAG: hypothetical protein P9L99_05750 [Candidatus Lernaella stagnicola]|nr:hypothetical protein [Candidatus Lernaella stagnicola]